jgi:hypothetical protein
MTEPLIVYDAHGVAHEVDKSAAFARLAFKAGRIPTEVLINGKKPGITAPSLRKLAPTLRMRRRPGH